MATFIALRALNHSSGLRVPAVGLVNAPATLARTVTGADGTFSAGTYYYVVTAIGDGGETPVSNEVSAVVPAAANEVQHINKGGATGGTYKLTFNAVQTGVLNFGDSATVVQTALRGLSSINGANVNVVASGNGFDVTFVGTLANTNVSPMTVADSTTGGTGVVVTTTTSGQAANHVALTWADDTGADSYRVYRGTGAGTEDHYQTSTTNSFTDLGAVGTAGTPPSSDTASSALGEQRLKVDQDTIVNVDDVRTRRALNNHRSIGQYVVTAFNISTATASPPANS